MDRNSGWLCPKCNKAHAPWITTCPEKTTDLYDYYNLNFWPKCNCKPGTFCGNVNCPYVTKIEC